MSAAADSPLPSAHWAALARAAAEARRFRVDGLAGCYDDLYLWTTADRRATGQLEREVDGDDLDDEVPGR